MIVTYAVKRSLLLIEPKTSLCDRNKELKINNQTLTINLGELIMFLTIFTSIVTSLITVFGTFYVQERKLKTEFRTEFMAEQVAEALLKNEQWKKRTFTEIQKRLGGFEDDELRKILVRAGAIRFESKTEGEMWGLLSRNWDEINRNASKSITQENII